MFHALHCSWIEACRPGSLDPSLIHDAALYAESIAKPVASAIRVALFVPAYAAYAAAGNNTAHTAAVAIVNAAEANRYSALRTGFPRSREATAERAERRTNKASEADYQAIRNGSPTTNLAQSPLWSGEAVAWFGHGWDRLKRAMNEADEDWDVWINWYESRLRGSDFDLNLDVHLAETVAKEWPRRSPRTINVLLKDRLPQIQGELFEGAKLLHAGEFSHDAASLAALEPIPNVPSPFDFAVADDARIVAIAGLSNWPILPLPTSEDDHRNRLEACQMLCTDLIDDLQSGMYQIRVDYLTTLKRYMQRLPNKPNSGNILLADAEIRTIRAMFAAEVAILSLPIASKLRTLIEHHIGLRVYYPDIARFYRDVQAGRIDAPLPLDAVEGVISTVSQNTPAIFDSSVVEAIGGAKTPVVPLENISAVEAPPLTGSEPTVPSDPLGELNPRKAHDFMAAATINRLWKAFLEGEKVGKAVQGWREAASALRSYVQPVLKWLSEFMDSGAPPTS